MLEFIKKFSREIIIGTVAGLLTTVCGAVIGLDKIVDFINHPAIVPDGFWNGSHTENGKTILSALHLISRGKQIEGSMLENRGSLESPKKFKSVLKGSIDGNDLSLSISSALTSEQDTKTEYIGKFSPDGKALTGICKGSWGTGTFKFTKNE